jgi:hypothetical protein
MVVSFTEEIYEVKDGQAPFRTNQYHDKGVDFFSQPKSGRKRNSLGSPLSAIRSLLTDFRVTQSEPEPPFGYQK